jgi:hypothetical protein
MAKQVYDVDSMVDQVYRLESIATSDQTFTEDDVIEFLNLELQTTVTPLIQSVNEEFGVMSVDYDIASLTPSVRIESMATGNRLRSVQLINSQGLISNLPRLDPDKLGSMTYYTYGFYIKNNELVFYPQVPPYGTGTLRLNYFRRPNKLVAENTTGRVIAVDTIGNTVTLNNAPVGDDWTAGGTIDVIHGGSPFDFVAQAVEIVSIAGPSVELDAATIAEIEVGDYLALEGESPVAQFVPAEAVGYLCQLAAARCLQSLGDTEGHAISIAKADGMRVHLLNLISDRIDGQPRKLLGIGLGRRRAYGTWWY